MSSATLIGPNPVLPERGALLTDDEVCDGEREEEVVGDGLQLLVHLEADHHLWSWRTQV